MLTENNFEQRFTKYPLTAKLLAAPRKTLKGEKSYQHGGNPMDRTRSNPKCGRIYY